MASDDGDAEPIGDGAPISDEAAIHAARHAIAGHVTIAEAAEVRIERLGGEVVVEFGHPLAPGERGPDYDARVSLDARTGEVISILGGS